MACLPFPTHLLGAVCIAHLVIDVRDHLQRPAQRRQGLPAGGQTHQAGCRRPQPLLPRKAAPHCLKTWLESTDLGLVPAQPFPDMINSASPSLSFLIQ